VAQKNILPN